MKQMTEVVVMYPWRVQDCMTCPFLHNDDYVRSCGHDNAPTDYNKCRSVFLENRYNLTESCPLVQAEKTKEGAK